MHRPPARLGDQARVLQIALAPAAVALQFGEQVRRVLLEAAGELRREPDLVAGAAHHRRLDEVVREDRAREAAAAGDRRQRAVAHERLDAQDRVVPPVVRLAELPVRHAEGEQAPGHAVGELLQARMQRGLAAATAASSARCRRADAPPSGAPGRPGCRRSSCCRRRAPPCSGSGGPSGGRSRPRCRPCAGCAGAASGRRRARPPAPARRRARRASAPRRAARRRAAPGRRVGEHVDVEQRQRARRGERRAGGAQAAEDGGDVLVADRHDERRARRLRRSARARLARRQAMRVAAQHHPHAHQRGDEAAADPGEEQRRQRRVGDPDAIERRPAPPRTGATRPPPRARRRSPAAPRAGAGRRPASRRAPASPSAPPESAKGPAAVRARGRTTAPRASRSARSAAPSSAPSERLGPAWEVDVVVHGSLRGQGVGPGLRHGASAVAQEDAQLDRAPCVPAFEVEGHAPAAAHGVRIGDRAQPAHVAVARSPPRRRRARRATRRLAPAAGRGRRSRDGTAGDRAPIGASR